MATTYVFPTGVQKLMGGGFDLDTDTIKAMLLTTSYTVDLTDEFVGDLSAEVADGSYARQTVNVSALTVTGESITADVTGTLNFGAVAGNFRYLVFYKHVTNDADSPLISMIDNGDTASLGRQPVFTISNILEGVV